MHRAGQLSESAATSCAEAKNALINIYSWGGRRIEINHKSVARHTFVAKRHGACHMSPGFARNTGWYVKPPMQRIWDDFRP